MREAVRKVLVTGAGGYIGCSLVPELARRGYEVRALDKYTRGQDRHFVHSGVSRIYADTRTWSGEGLEGIDAVIDLAAISHDRRGEITPHETLDINQFARYRTAKRSREAGAGRYILMSTCGVYGFRDDPGGADEKAVPNPLTTYARAASRSERDILLLCREGFDVTVARPAILYGYSPRMRFDLAVNAMVRAVWQTGTITLQGGGGQWRPFVHLKDAVEAVCCLLEAPAEKVSAQIFNIGSGGQNIRIRDLAELVAAVLPIPVEIRREGPADPRSYRINADKIGALLGWKASHSLKEGIEELYGKLARSIV
ncbi:NAD-dependent epimerase/dehydratase family protein [Paenibacillus chitinolyticus]|uniref:NAD-dependent epimerase/dehydratase family protein n=1 Tax=Paenibacillus chitinolyticus TaxID=79263 RepID=UPI003D08F6A2